MLGTILIFVLAALAGVFFAQSSLLDRAKDEQKDELLTAKDKATIMIMGVDERTDDVGRSDTLMVATIDPHKNEAALLSIPRDTRVAIPKNGYDKINAAYAYGGEKLTQRTVEDFLGIRIDHYVIINTHAFQKIIDAIGGIDIDVEKRMYYEDPWDDDGGLVIDLRPGRQHMDGKTAVTYVRYRDEEGDIGRVKRQQKFMRACVDAVTTPAILPRLPGIISSVIDSVKTDLSVRQMLEFIGTLKQAQANGLRTDMVPGRPLYIEGISYWIPDMEQLRRNIVNALGISLNANERSRMERAIREYENSIPAGATEVPEGDNSIGRRVSGDEALDTRSRKRSSSDDSSKTERKSTERKNSDKGSKSQSTDTSPPKKSTDSDSGNSGRHASTRQSSNADSGGGDTAAPQRSGGSPGKEN
ncbi:cell envelope-like function transcriptional attenuator common domain protein [Selenomonas flueggei ATCC 43531]|uniref:Cell envelope-like function transcriptional attenuator common domain protein n=1 Tax=Selenomonas flueggei ATCC 43531 TaxID=638302 RepID=C4V1T0_9FIRM|nr:cell envelope-like function transcriptional attenuator common domain protein [Selenomonas flueggei ATCC 43531]